MSGVLRKIVIRVLTPLSWRASNNRQSKSLNRFSQTEADSAWQMLQALDAVEDPHFQGELFNNALEEVHHAALFHDLARAYSDFPLPLDSPRRQQLFDPEADFALFEAYHFVGELDVYEEFWSYAGAAPVERVRETFLQIRGDEEEHQKLAYRELIKLAGSEAGARKLIRRVRRTRAWEAWVRFGKGIGDVMSSIVLSGIYVLAAPFFSVLCRRRLNDLGWKEKLRRTTLHAVEQGAGSGVATSSDG